MTSNQEKRLELIRENKITQRNMNLTSFDELKVVTAGIQCRIDPKIVEKLNLSAIARIFDVSTRQIAPEDRKTKQGKLVYPESFNEPGKILHIKYMDPDLGRIFKRGIDRSTDEDKCFPNMITFDIGTKNRIVSVKFSRSLVITGCRTMDEAKEVLDSFIEPLEKYQQALNLYRANPIEERMSPLLSGKPEEEHEWIRKFAAGDDNFFSGSHLHLVNYTVNMIKLSTHLCVPISRYYLSKVIADKFTIQVSSAQNVQGIHFRHKMDSSKHNITINQSGYFTYIGSDLGVDYRSKMMPVYNTLMRLILDNFNNVISLHRMIIEKEDYENSYAREALPLDFDKQRSLIYAGPFMTIEPKSETP